MIKTTSDSKCTASVGKRKEKGEFLSLDPNACNKRSIYRGLLHTIGLINEHQRSDRDVYVEVHEENVANKRLFQKFNTSQNFGLYDHYSIMHAKALEDSIHPGVRKKTITSKVLHFKLITFQFSEHNCYKISVRPKIQAQ